MTLSHTVFGIYIDHFVNCTNNNYKASTLPARPRFRFVSLDPFSESGHKLFDLSTSSVYCFESVHICWMLLSNQIFEVE